MQYQRKHVAIAAASGFEPRFLSLSNLASHPIHETQQPYPIGHAGLLDVAVNSIFDVIKTKHHQGPSIYSCNGDIGGI